MSDSKDLPRKQKQIGILQQREIEAGVIAPIYRLLVQRLGEEAAREIITEAILSDAEEAGRDFAKDVPEGQEMRHFIDIQRYWEQDDALVTEHIEESDSRYSYNVYRCGYAEMYQRLGIPELGKLLSCNRDFAFARGYNPNLELTRTQTIMEGADHCPFHYVLTSAAVDDAPVCKRD